MNSHQTIAADFSPVRLQDGLASSDDRLRPPAPEPRTTPLGLIKLLKTLWSNPIEAWSQKHFEQWIIRENFGFGDVFVVSHPDAIRRVLLDNAANYNKDPLQVRVLSAGLKGGLLTASGQKWKAQRRTLAPLFSHKAVSNLAQPMTRAVDTAVTRWKSMDGGVLDMDKELTRLTFDILEQTIFSDGLGQDPDTLREAMTTYFETIGRIDPFDVMGLPSFVPRIVHLRATRTLRIFNEAVDVLIERRREKIAQSPGARPNDLLTLLIEAKDPQTNQSMEQAELKANILTFIAAGQETTANLISWSLYLLSQSDEWRERAAAEAERHADTPRREYTAKLTDITAVIDEAMRLYPPIISISRAAEEPDELAGQPIKAGAMVVISPYVLHRHRKLWPDPDVFDPTRFLGEARQKIGRFSHLPFGVGPHTCIGGYFAMQQATFALAEILRNFDFRMKPGHDVWPLLRMTLRPAGGLPMILTPKH
jgi:cytochrome P450